MMDRSAYVSSLRRDGAGLLAAADLGLDAEVPSCPGWRVERLVGHIGRVYRTMAGWVLSGSAPTDVPRPPAGPSVLSWTAEALESLVAALSSDSRPDPVPTWAGDQPALFWPRRMAVETAIHRWDAESAHGAPQPIDAELAVDAVDELFDVLLPVRASEDALTGDGETLHLHATDVDGEWLVTLTPGRPAVSREHAKGDVAVRGPASDLLLLLWNRGDVAGRERLQIFGDAALLDRWSESIRL